MEHVNAVEYIKADLAVLGTGGAGMASAITAAEAVCEDLGLKKWWSEPKMVTEARQKGLL